MGRRFNGRTDFSKEMTLVDGQKEVEETLIRTVREDEDLNSREDVREVRGKQILRL